jgi:predicted ribosome quality control (RQC) complex YloA/Tae2 family protein
MKKYESMPAQKVQSFQGVLDFFYNQLAYSEEAVQESQEAKELKKSIERQMSLIAGVDAESAEFAAKAGVIMRNLPAINAIIDFLRQNRRATKDDVQAVAQGIKILDVNLKEKSVRIEL